MSNRRLAVLVAVAVAAGATVAGVGLATQGSSKPARVLQIDEVNGRVGAVVLGETRENIIGALGQPERPSPGLGVQPMRYPHLEIDFRNGRVAFIATNDPAAQTEKAVRIGEPISAARASYRKAATCVPSSPDRHAAHPHCTVKVPTGTLTIVGDPIEEMILSRTR